MRAGLILSLLLLTASSTGAQPFPGAVLVNGGWVPCSHQVAIDAGLGCVAAPAPLGTQAVTWEVGRFYRNPSNTCTFKLLALAATYQHRRVMLIGETVDGRYAGCPEVVYFFDPTRPPEAGWRDVTETIPPEAR